MLNMSISEGKASEACETLQPLNIPQWKCEDITMDFVVGLPRTKDGYNAIWVIMDRLTKSTHFLPVHTTYTMDK